MRSISLKLKKGDDLQLSAHADIDSLEIISKSKDINLETIPKNLKKLTLNIKDQTEDLSFLNDLINLEYLKIINANFQRISIPNENLKTLIISRSNLEQTPLLSDSCKLEVLDLSHNKLTDLKGINLKSIKRLNLDQNDFKEFHDNFFKMPQINHLSLEGNQINDKDKKRIEEIYNIIITDRFSSEKSL